MVIKTRTLEIEERVFPVFSPFFRFSLFFSAFIAFLSVFLCIFAKEY
jgi:hypothetical protein